MREMRCCQDFWQDVIFGSVKGLSFLSVFLSGQDETVILFNAFIKILGIQKKKNGKFKNKGSTFLSFSLSLSSERERER